jgi:hypothetical protein
VSGAAIRRCVAYATVAFWIAVALVLYRVA